MMNNSSAASLETVRTGLPMPSSGLWEQAQPRMAKRSGHAVSEGLEARSERQARGCGQLRPGSNT